MSKNVDKTEAPRVLPDLTPKAIRWAKLPHNLAVAIEGDFLLVRMPVSAAAMEAAQPSKSGALCMVAGGASAWHKIDEAITDSGLPSGARLNISFGIPNPLHDKEAAKKRRLLAQMKAAGITAADLAA